MANKNTDGKYIVYVVLDIYPCATGGMEIFYNKLLPEISKEKKVLLVTCCRKIESAEYEIKRIPQKFFSIPGTGKYAKLFFTALALIKNKARIAVVHVPYTSNAGRWGYIFPFLSRVFGIKYLLQIHAGGMKKWGFLSGNKTLFKHADRLLGVSDVIKNEYEKRSGKNIEIVFPLIPFKKPDLSKDEIKKKRGFSAGDKIILFLGSLKDLKAPGVLLSAFISLGHRYINSHRIKLLFVGEGHLKEELRSRAEEQGLSNDVIFTGNVAYDMVPEYYAMADIYVIPSDYEGTSKSLLEAMFNKLPIIGSDVNGINNVLENNKDALLFPKRDSNKLAEKIKTLIEGSELNNKLGCSAYDLYLKKYSYHKSVNKLQNIYNHY